MLLWNLRLDSTRRMIWKCWVLNISYFLLASSWLDSLLASLSFWWRSSSRNTEHWGHQGLDLVPTIKRNYHFHLYELKQWIHFNYAFYLFIRCLFILCNVLLSQINVSSQTDILDLVCRVISILYLNIFKAVHFQLWIRQFTSKL